MTLFAELQRRKVFKVGAAYLVVAWLLIQVVATLAPQLQLPDWAPRLVPGRESVRRPGSLDG